MHVLLQKLSRGLLARCVADTQVSWRIWIAPALVSALMVPLVVSLPLIQRDLIDGVLLAGRLDRLLPTVGLFAGAWLLIAVLQVLSAVSRAYLDERLTVGMRRTLFAHCESLSVPLWHREHSGRIMALFSSDAPAVTGFIGSGMVFAFGHVVVLLASAFVLLRLNWQLAVVVVCVPPAIAGLAWVITRPLRAAARAVRDKNAELNEQLHESLGGLREIAAFGQEDRQGARFLEKLTELFQLRMRLSFLGAGILAGQSLFSLVVTLTLLGVGGYLVITRQISMGTLIAFQQLYGQVYQPAMSLSATFVGMHQVLASADRLYEVLDARPLVQERGGARDPGRVAGEVSFDNVSFAYVPERPALHDVSFVAQPGETVALVGPSGAGKSTLTGLLARFYDPDRGRILLDGTDLRDLTLSGLRRQLAMVFQDPFLFDTTIRENIAFGGQHASEEAIVAAATAANAWDFIAALPAGLDTKVGQRAVQLSEGQKQRVAIARALLRDPKILILDEPTSALDARSEHLLQSALDRLMAGRTTFVIAHRLATVRGADRILVLDNGHVVEQGTHQGLLAHRGLYWELHQLQFSEPGAATRVKAEPVALATA